MKRRVCFSVVSFFTVAAFLLLIPTPADSPGLLGQEVIRPVIPATPFAQVDKAAKAQIATSYGKLPLSFEPNEGQTSKGVKFLSRGSGYSLFLTSDEAVLALRDTAREAPKNGMKVGPNPKAVKTAVLHMKLVGANQSSKVNGLDGLPGKSNYLIGNNPKKWHTNIPNYAKVRYENVYPGIDLVYYGNQRQLEYDFVVAPGSDPKAIALEITGTKGTAPASLAKNGDLVIKTEGGEVRLHKPVVYQTESSGSATSSRKSVEGHFVLLAKNRVGFKVSPYDPAKPLYIDPVISYATYLGSTGWDTTRGIAVDAAGNAYVIGQTGKSDFPITDGAFNTGPSTSNDVFVTKLSADGSSLVYSTYLGGSLFEDGEWIAVDAIGNAYVTGQTNSEDFPITENAYQKTWGGGTCNFTFHGSVKSGCRDAFVTKLNAVGSALLYSTYLGGSNDDFPQMQGIAIDAAGNAYVAGMTRSSNFPLVNPIQPAFHGGTCGSGDSSYPCADGYVAKINTLAVGAASLVYSTYVGGSNDDDLFSIALDGNGNAYVTGYTLSNDFPVTAGAFRTVIAGQADAFVTKINSAGSAFTYSTVLGGADFDAGVSVAVDASGNAYITGPTGSNDFPTTEGAFDAKCGASGQCNGLWDGFVTKLNADGSKLVYSTYLGGSGQDMPYSIAVDKLGIAYVTGVTDSADFPIVRFFYPFRGGTCGSEGDTYTCPDAFMSKLSAGGEGLIISTYLGGSGEEEGKAIAIDSSRDVYVTGLTSSTDFPITSAAYQTKLAGETNAFVVKLSDMAVNKVIQSATSLTFGEQAVGTTSSPQTVTYKNIGDAAAPVLPFTVTGDFQFTNTCGTSIPPGGSCSADFTFTPKGTGTRTGEVKVYNEEFGEWSTVLTLTGVGIAPSISTTPSSLTFDSQLADSASEAQTVTVKNTGTVPVNISSIQGSTHFAETHSCGTSLDPGKSCTINVTFAPKAAGLLTEQILINHDGAGSPNSITLTGKGTDFALQSGSGGSSASVKAGQTATYNLTVNPMGYSGEVEMKCQWYQTVPGGTSCSVSPSTLNLEGTHAASVVVTITTTSRSIAPVLREPQPPGQGGYPVSHLAMWLLALAVAVSLLARRQRVTVTLASLLFMVTLWAACGGSAPSPLPVTGTAAGTYSLSAVGTTSVGEKIPTYVTRSTPLTLEVQ